MSTLEFVHRGRIREVRDARSYFVDIFLQAIQCMQD